MCIFQIIDLEFNFECDVVNFKEEIVYDICIVRRLRFKGIFFIV